MLRVVESFAGLQSPSVCLGLMILTLASDANGEQVVLDCESGVPDAFRLLNANASVTRNEPLSGKASLLLDTTRSREEWNPALQTARGVLKPDTDYVMTFKCKILTASKDAMVHCFVRPLDATGSARDVARLNFTETNAVKILRLKFHIPARASNYSFQISPRFRVRALVDDLRITEGTGERYYSAAENPVRYENPIDLAAGSPEFEVDLPRSGNKTTVSVAEFGARASNEDNTEAFAAAIRHCKAVAAARLIVPKGVYRFTSSKAVRLAGMVNFEFDGQGSELVFHKKSGGLLEVAGCERIVLKDLVLDWDWEKDPLGSVVEVADVGPGGGYLDLKFVHYTDFPRRDVRIAILEGLDRKTMSVGYEGSVNISGEFTRGKDKPRTEWLSGNLLRLHAAPWQKPTFATRVRKNDLFRIRHYVYDMNGVTMSDNRHLTLSGVTIYSCPGHAFVSSGDQHHWQFLDCRIIRRPGTERPVTCTADHHHVARSQGFFKMLRCEFSLGGDDCLNVHDNSSFATRVGEHAVEVRNGGIAEVGDLVELRNDDYSPTGFTARVKKKEASRPAGGGNGSTRPRQLVFEEPVPAQTTSGFVLFNWRYDSRNIIVRDCYFHDNRARGLLLLGRAITVENNRFVHNQMCGIKIETGYTFDLWSEGYGASNIVIRNNVFDGVNPVPEYPNEKYPIIYMSAYLKTDPSAEKTSYPILKDILVEKNTFVNPPGVICYVCCANNVTIRDNRILVTEPRKENHDFRGAVGVAYASDLRVIHNTWVRSAYANRPGVFADEETTRGVVCQGNVVAGPD